MSFSKISNNPSEYGIKLPAQNFGKDDEVLIKRGGVNTVCAMHLFGLLEEINGITGYVFGINKNRIRDGKAYFVPAAKHEDFIHIFIPGDFVTKYETLIYVEDNTGKYIPVMIPVCADEEGRNKPYAFKQKLGLNTYNERVVMNFLAKYWKDIRKLSSYFYDKDVDNKLQRENIAYLVDNLLVDPKKEKELEKSYYWLDHDILNETEEEFNARMTSRRYRNSPQYRYDYYKNLSDTLEANGKNMGPDFGFACRSSFDIAGIRAYRAQRDKQLEKELRKNKG